MQVCKSQNEMRTDSIDESVLERWKKIVQTFDYAFQPIVNIHTGECYGVEALLRNCTEAGFATIQDVFDCAYSENMLFQLDLLLLKKVLDNFKKIHFYKNIKLFYNIDNRTHTMEDYSADVISHLIEQYEIQPGTFFFEISERHDFRALILQSINTYDSIKSIMDNYRHGRYRIAIDDFGAGFSGLELLYHSEPDCIKIDRFFIARIATDSRKKLFVESTVRIAHTLGIIVIAEGLETQEEIYECKRLGCDYIQGYYIQRPTVVLNEVSQRYGGIAELSSQEQRTGQSDHEIITNQMRRIPTISLYDQNGEITPMQSVLEAFRNTTATFFPVLNSNDEPVGIIRECDLKKYVYSPFGKDLLKNKSSDNIIYFLSKTPAIELRTQVETILELFSVNAENEGIILTDNGRYEGFLDANSLIKALNEKNIADARDQNPLTRLPGNILINRYISKALDKREKGYVFVYFDFDYFKPFNDLYGFRQGDRVILLFSDILRDIQNRKRVFIGHIGGDDFFIGMDENTGTEEEIIALTADIISRFKSDVKAFYKTEDIAKGFIVSNDRNGHKRRFPLLEVSAAVLIVSDTVSMNDTEQVFSLMAEVKKEAKKAPVKYVVRRLMLSNKLTNYENINT